MGDSLQLKIKDLHIEGLAESLEINLDSIISNSIVVTDFHIDDDNLHKCKIKAKTNKSLCLNQMRIPTQ